MIVIATFDVRDEEQCTEKHSPTCLHVPFLHKVKQSVMKHRLILYHLGVLYERLCDVQFARICAILQVCATSTVTYAACTRCDECCQNKQICMSHMFCIVCTSVHITPEIKNQSRLSFAVHLKLVMLYRLQALTAINLLMTHRPLVQHIT